jgi:YceI-like domain
MTLELDPANTRIEFTFGSHSPYRARNFRAQEWDNSFQSIQWRGRRAGSRGCGQRRHRKYGSRPEKCTRKILESQRYPEITFPPTRMFGKLELEGDSKVQVDGILRLHGSDHVMTLTLPVQTKGNSLSVRTHIVIPYVEWGLNNPKHVPASRSATRWRSTLPRWAGF